MNANIAILAESLSPDDTNGLYSIGIAGRVSTFISPERAQILRGSLKLVERNLPPHEIKAARALIGFYEGAIQRENVRELAGLGQIDLTPALTSVLERRAGASGYSDAHNVLDAYCEVTSHLYGLLDAFFILNREGFFSQADLEDDIRVYTGPDIVGMFGGDSQEAAVARDGGYTHMAWQYDITANPEDPSSPVPYLVSGDVHMVLGTIATGIPSERFVPGHTFPVSADAA